MWAGVQVEDVRCDSDVTVKMCGGPLVMKLDCKKDLVKSEISLLVPSQNASLARIASDFQFLSEAARNW